MLSTSEINDIFAPWDNPDCPGGAVAVLHKNEIVYKQGFGLANTATGQPFLTDTVCRIASMTKQFTTTLVLLAEERGLLSLENSVSDYLPGTPSIGKGVTIRQLCNNTSGWRDQLNLVNIAGGSLTKRVTGEDIRTLLCAQACLQFTPGERFQYSNSNFVILSWIIEDVMQKPFAQCLEDDIFSPLGMTNTALCEYAETDMPAAAAVAYLVPRDGGNWQSNPRYAEVSLLGEGGMISTVEDLIRWEKNFSNNRIGTPNLLTKLADPGVLNSGVSLNYGLGLFFMDYCGVRIEGHPGMLANIRSSRLRVPDEEFAVMVLTNHPQLSPVDMSLELINRYLSKQPTVTENDHIGSSTAISVLPKPACGVYSRTDNGFSVQLLNTEDGPVASICGLAYPIYAADDGVWRSGNANPDRPLALDITDIPHSLGVSLGHGPFLRYLPESEGYVDLSLLAGEYHCDELNSTYDIDVTDGQLALSARCFLGSFSNRILEHLEGYVFLLDIENEGKANLRFVEDETSHITGLRVGGDRSEGLYYARRRTGLS